MSTFIPFLPITGRKKTGEMKVCVAATLAHRPQPPRRYKGREWLYNASHNDSKRVFVSGGDAACFCDARKPIPLTFTRNKTHLAASNLYSVFVLMAPNKTFMSRHTTTQGMFGCLVYGVIAARSLPPHPSHPQSLSPFDLVGWSGREG